MNKLLFYSVAGALALTLAGSNVFSHGHPGDDEEESLEHSSSAAALAEVRPGALLLVGGGHLPDAVGQRFLELAGGREARLVIIPSASSLPDAAAESYAYWKTAAVKSVRILHTTRRAEADEPRFYGQLRDATGVWIAGGDQSRLTALYGGTGVERELHNVLRRGGVVGGTSAGASVASGVMMAGGNAEKGFGLIDTAIVDQHFSNRGRLPRLLRLLQNHPDQLGIGIDEETAVLIRGDEVAVLGNATVTVARPDGLGRSVRVYPAGSRFRQPAVSVAAR
jgi:cyanophycinase